MAEWLRLFVQPDDVVGLRASGVDGPEHTTRGYFDHENLEMMAQAALELSGKTRGVSFTLNPLRLDVLGRSPNEARQIAEGDDADDADVGCLRWLLLDLHHRKRKVPATATEKDRVKNKAERIQKHLREQGWPDPIFADAGNGYHLLYRIDLPVEESALLQRVLNALGDRFDDRQVVLDRTTFHPARLTPLYGTKACEGAETEHRPHRWTAILGIPAEVKAVPKEQVESLAMQARELRSGPRETGRAVELSINYSQRLRLPSSLQSLTSFKLTGRKRGQDHRHAGKMANPAVGVPGLPEGSAGCCTSSSSPRNERRWSSLTCWGVRRCGAATARGGRRTGAS